MKNPFAILAEASDSIRPMKSSTAPDITRTPPTPSGRRAVTELNFDSPPRPIAEFAGRPDFPECALGEHIDIGGYAGVLVEIVNHSIKVKSPEGIMQSFNFPRLRQIYGPDPRREVNEVASRLSNLDPFLALPNLRPPLRNGRSSPNQISTRK